MSFRLRKLVQMFGPQLCCQLAALTGVPCGPVRTVYDSHCAVEIRRVARMARANLLPTETERKQKEWPNGQPKKNAYLLGALSLPLLACPIRKRSKRSNVNPNRIATMSVAAPAIGNLLLVRFAVVVKRRAVLASCLLQPWRKKACNRSWRGSAHLVIFV